MPLAYPVLLLSKDWPFAYRWRLASALYAQGRSLVEGSLATAVAALVCLLRSGWPWFGCLIGLSLAILVWRLAQARAFRRDAGRPEAARRSPEHWGMQFTIGASIAAVNWGLIDYFALTSTHDQVLQMFVFMMQSGWLGGVCVRNAASPLSVVAQVSISTCCIWFSLLFVPVGFMWIVAVMALILARAVVNASSQFGEDMCHTMRSEQQLEIANATLTELSTTDGLTRIGNRRAFDDKLQVEWARAARDATDLALLLLDVDHFKRFNDQYGHPAGDDCLRAVAASLAGCLRRPPDFAARFGGEEFVVLLSATGTDGACNVAERVRAAVQALGLPHAGSPFEVVTISIGVASLAPHPGDKAETLIALADQALYVAKHDGRNRVRAASVALNLSGAKPKVG